MYAEELRGEVVAFVYRAEDGGFAVVRVADGPDEHVAVGPLAHLHEGQRIIAAGQWSIDLRFGKRFKVETVLVEEPRTLAGLEKYLVAAVEGVGPELARRIVDHFGLETLRMLESAPERLTEVHGVGARTQERIVATWIGERAGREVDVTLRAHGVGTAAVRKVLATFGNGAMDVVSRAPYRLVEVPGIGFRTADVVARANGVGRDDPARAQAAIDFSLAAAEGEGSCFLPEAALLERLVGLDVPRTVAEQALDFATHSCRVVRQPAPEAGSRAVYRAPTDAMESRVARRVAARVRGIVPGALDIDAAAAAVGLNLAEGQREAVLAAFSARIMVITGGPGTGKTSLVRVLAEMGRRRGEDWLFASPTGRAARRLAQACGSEAVTIHRLLEFGGDAGAGFARDAANPLACDVLLVDEASMVDLALFDAVLDALPAKSRIVLVGDIDQLPSVGAGQVLRDLIASGIVPVARLSLVFRQAAESAIVRNAHRILAGEVPISAEKEDGARDCFVIDREDANDALRTLLTVVTERLPSQGFDPRRDVQVLTPMHGGPLGTVALNLRLGSVLNPAGAEIVRGNRRFRVGDRVIQTKNDYELEVFNGDVGWVVAVSPSAMSLDLEGRVVLVSADSLDTFEPAWAITIHKSQGSEYPAVVLVLHTGHFVMLQRNLLYTALTRAKRFACLVASPRALRMAVQRAGVDERHTGLARRARYSHDLSES